MRSIPQTLVSTESFLIIPQGKVSVPQERNRILIMERMWKRSTQVTQKRRGIRGLPPFFVGYHFNLKIGYTILKKGDCLARLIKQEARTFKKAVSNLSHQAFLKSEEVKPKKLNSMRPGIHSCASLSDLLTPRIKSTGIRLNGLLLEINCAVPSSPSILNVLGYAVYSR